MLLYPRLVQVSLEGTCTFSRALKTEDGELPKGSPYLPGVVVEGRFEDEFRWGPSERGSVAALLRDAGGGGFRVTS